MRILLAALLCAGLVLPAAAGTLAGVSFPDTASVEGQTLRLNGMALRTKLIFKVYVAGLYLPSKQTDGKKVLDADAPRHLVMQFVRSVDKKSICGAWNDGLKANVSNPSSELKGQFTTLCDWMEAMKNGDRMSFSYTPESGTRVEIRGKEKGTMAGKAFADALFASFIGAKPGPGEDFKQDLLGG